MGDVVVEKEEEVRAKENKDAMLVSVKLEVTTSVIREITCKFPNFFQEFLTCPIISSPLNQLTNVSFDCPLDVKVLCFDCLNLRCNERSPAERR